MPRPNDQIVPTATSRYSDFNPDPNETDLFGSSTLHHAVAHDDPDIRYMKILLEKDCNCASQTNQFNRIPLHYVLDRCNASYEAVRLLIKYYPSGARVADDEGVTPYDLALKWNHDNRVLRELLRQNIDMDRSTYRRITLGPFFYLYKCLICGAYDAHTSTSRHTGMDSNDGNDCVKDYTEEEETADDTDERKVESESERGVEDLRKSASLEKLEEEEGLLVAG